MSRRRRQSVKQTGTPQIEWLKHRTGYPSPEEREKIILLRQELSIELVKLMVMGAKPDSALVYRLAEKYGEKEVERATKIIGETLDLPTLIADDAKSYREYRRRYARFGAGLKYYTNREIDELHDVHFKALKGSGEADEANKPDELLLYGWRDWEDITPPAVPLPPEDRIVPQPASYPAPVNELLEWGDDLYKSHKFADEADFAHWRKHIPALTRMALDPGLLNGWPADRESWAPWHAIHALGALQAWESAPALAALADLENDWLSDHLPHIWADMGREVEPSLWMILENNSASAKQRGLAADSLYRMTEEDDAMEYKVVRGFEKILGNTKAFDPSVNAYVIHFLRKMKAQEEVRETVELAFNEERVNLDIITYEDFDEDDDDVEFDEDFDEDE